MILPREGPIFDHRMPVQWGTTAWSPQIQHLESAPITLAPRNLLPEAGILRVVLFRIRRWGREKLVRTDQAGPGSKRIIYRLGGERHPRRALPKSRKPSL